MRYQMLTGSVNIDTDAFFTLSYLSTTRGNSMKLFKPQFTSVHYGKTYSETVLLTIEIRFRIVFLSPSVASFKRKLRSLNFHL